jgi:hypothetical protein
LLFGWDWHLQEVCKTTGMTDSFLLVYDKASLDRQFPHSEELGLQQLQLPMDALTVTQGSVHQWRAWSVCWMGGDVNRS